MHVTSCTQTPLKRIAKGPAPCVRAILDRGRRSEMGGNWYRGWLRRTVSDEKIKTCNINHKDIN